MAFYLSGHQPTPVKMAKPVLSLHGGYDFSNIANAFNPKYSATVNKALGTWGDYVVYGTVKVGRTPIASFVKSALDILSLGKFAQARNNAGGELYHLFSQIPLKNPNNPSDTTYMQIEKNEVISIKTQNKEFDAKDSVSFATPNETLTFRNLIDLTQKRMGDKFVVYDAATNNCQHFILNLMSAMYNFYYPGKDLPSELRDYIYQPVEQAMKKIYAVSTIGKKLTDLAGFGRRLFGFGFDDDSSSSESSSDE